MAVLTSQRIRFVSKSHSNSGKQVVSLSLDSSGLGQQRGYGGKRETDSSPSSIYQIALPSSHKLIPRSNRRVFSLSLFPWKFEEKGFGPGNLNRRIAVESSPSICPARTSVRSLSPRMKFAGDCSVHHQRQQQRGL